MKHTRIRRLLVLLAALSLILLVTGSALAGPSDPATSFTEAAEGRPLPPAAPAQQSAPDLSAQATAASLTFFTDRTAFDTAAPGQPVENFENTLVPPGGITVCAGPFNSATNDACFAPGGILDGISIDEIGGGGMVVLGQGAVGNPTAAVGPNIFADDTVMTFPNDDVKAVGMDILNLVGGTTADVQIFGAGNALLGNTTATMGQFWGVVSDQVITKITWVRPK